MKIYNFDPMTGEYLGQSEASLDPLETHLAKAPRYLIPAHAATKAPPTVEAKQAAVWRTDKWEIVPDHRGETRFDPETGAAFDIREIGVKPAGPIEPPPPGLLRPTWGGGKWLEGATAEEAAAAERTAARAELAAIDADIGQIVEDLISALVGRGAIVDADLSQASRDILAARKALREKL